jgi:hypothetical protein
MELLKIKVSHSFSNLGDDMVLRMRNVVRINGTLKMCADALGMVFLHQRYTCDTAYCAACNTASAEAKQHWPVCRVALCLFCLTN